MPIKGFGIFEGGGAKGLAHVGALKAVEARVQFLGVAGSSAGAIVAALVAAGYSADELYEKQSRGGALNIDFTYKFFGRLRWDEWKNFAADFKKSFCEVSVWGAWIRAPFLYLRHSHVIDRIHERHGVFSNQELALWVNELLVKKLRQRKVIDNNIVEVAFQHIDTPLKIVASNISAQRIEIYSRETTPEMSVAQAVAASASIPFFFIPSGKNGELVLDGGLLSNFPAWLFDTERRKYGPQMPTLGFRLVPELTSASGCADNFLGRLIYAVLAGDSSLEVREIENLHTIPLKVKVEATSFDLSDSELDRLYESGKTDAENYLISVYGPKDPSDMSEALKVAANRLLGMIGKEQTTHLRANIALRTTRGTLRITYCYKMDDDPDDRLEFEIGSGACGLCWNERDIVVCDLDEAKTTYKDDWNMNKYQQAMVCRELRSLLCVPIFEPESSDLSAQAAALSLIGVLNFDSKEDLLKEFENKDLSEQFMEIGSFLAEVMRENVRIAEVK